MTRDDIIRIARDNGIDWFRIPSTDQVLFEKFAVALAAAEREACADIASTCCEGCADAIRARGET